MNPKKTFFIVGGHIDDAEAGMGGMIIKAVRAGHRVVVLDVVGDLSTWHLTKGREERTLRAAQELAQSVGYEKHYLNGKYHQTLHTDLRLKAQIAEMYVELKPDAVFVMHPESVWPDHRESGLAAKDAVLFSHGYTRDRRIQRAPLIYGYGTGPVETGPFEPDVLYDISDVIQEYLDLYAGMQIIYMGHPPSFKTEYEIRSRSGSVFVSPSGLRVHAETLMYGERAGCQNAQGFTYLWGPRRGPELFS